MSGKTGSGKTGRARDCDIAIVGAGPAGLTAAAALAQRADAATRRVISAGPAFAPDPARPDTRTTALFRGGVRLLRHIGVFEACRPRAAKLEAIRIIDDTGRLLRAPEILFRAEEIGWDAFGYNIPNAVLVAALRDRMAELAGCEAIETEGIIEITPDAEGVTLRPAEGGAIRARLVIGADGRNSLCRKTAGIRAHERSYPQTAIACNFDHSAPHDNVSTEFHRPAGPFTTVPLPGNASSLVWVEEPAQAKRLMGLDEDAFAAAIETRLQGLLGRVGHVGPRAAFPLKGLTADGLARRRIALVGEAAHVIPPIGAQGLNLGFRDVGTLADCIEAAEHEGRDIGAPETLAAYERARRGDIWSRTLAVDILNRTLLSDLLPAQFLRSVGLQLLGTLEPLRRLVMREGLQPTGSLPRLMR